MRKKAFLFAVAVVFVSLASCATPQVQEQGQAYGQNPDDFVISVTDNTVMITGYRGTDTDVLIPAKINGLPVTSIDFRAFADNQLTSVTIPSSVISIGQQAFAGNQLTSVTIPNSVTSIGNFAFLGNQLTSVTLPNSVTSIGSGAFASDVTITGSAVAGDFLIGISNNALTITKYRGSATAVQIPAQINGLPVTSIGTAAFANNQLTSVTIPNSVTSIEGAAFANNQLTSVTLPNSVTSIGTAAFRNNLLTSVTIPNSVTSIGNVAFQNNLLTSVTIPNSVTSIEGAAFENNLLTSVTIPSSVTSIGGWAFENNQLTSVTILNSVTSIEQGAFRGNQLTSVTVPSSVTSIGSDVFLGNQLTPVMPPVGNIADYFPASVGNTWTYASATGAVVQTVRLAERRFGTNNELLLAFHTAHTGIGNTAALYRLENNRVDRLASRNIVGTTQNFTPPLGVLAAPGQEWRHIAGGDDIHFTTSRASITVGSRIFEDCIVVIEQVVVGNRPLLTRRSYFARGVGLVLVTVQMEGENVARIHNQLVSTNFAGF